MIACRSDSLHLWVVGTNLDSDEIRSALEDLEHTAWSLSEGTMAAPATGPRTDVHHLWSGLQFLRETLWLDESGNTCVMWGLLTRGGRLWAFRAGTRAQLEQLTGAPLRPSWHAHGGDPPFEWCELGAGEVWRLSAPGPTGPGQVHYRPALSAVAGDPAQVWETAARAEDAAQTETAESRRRRKKRERRAQHIALVPAAPESDAPVVEPPPFLEPKWAASPAAPAQPSLVAAPAAPAIPAPSRIRRSAPWQRWLRSIETRRRLAIAGAGLGLVAIACLAFVAKKPIAAFVEGRYEAELVTVPPGATIVIDGQPQTVRTPAVLALAPGEHKVELKLGEFAQAAFTIDGERDERVHKEIAWMGSLGVASADTAVRLSVALDGKTWGTTPLWKDDLPVGRHKLSFEAPGVRPWEEEVLVRAGQSSRVSAQPVRIPPFGLVTASAERVTPDGVEDVEGATVYVDSERAGVTPVDLQLPPGPHSIRVVTGGVVGPVHRIDVQAGGRYFAGTQFGRPPEPEVAFDPPKKLSLAEPPRLTFVLRSDLPLPVREMRLYVKPEGGAYARYNVPIANHEGQSVGTLAFPLEGIAAGTRVTYYAVIETREGEEYSSEVRRGVVVP